MTVNERMPNRDPNETRLYFTFSTARNHFFFQQLRETMKLSNSIKYDEPIHLSIACYLFRMFLFSLRKSGCHGSTIKLHVPSFISTVQCVWFSTIPLCSVFDSPQSHCAVCMILHNPTVQCVWFSTIPLCSVYDSPQSKGWKNHKNPPYFPAVKTRIPAFERKHELKLKQQKKTHEIVQNFPFLPRMEKRAADS